MVVQAMARVWRDGQKRSVHIYRLLCTGTIEEKIYQRQVSKQGLSGIVVDDKTNEGGGSVAFSLEELRDLFTLRTDTTSETYDLLGRPGHGGKSGEGKTSANLSAASSRIAKKKDSQLSMDELLKWKHYEPPIEDPEVDDAFLRECSPGLYSCLFMNRTVAAKDGQPGVDDNGEEVTVSTEIGDVGLGNEDHPEEETGEIVSGVGGGDEEIVDGGDDDSGDGDNFGDNDNKGIDDDDGVISSVAFDGNAKRKVAGAEDDDDDDTFNTGSGKSKKISLLDEDDLDADVNMM